MYRKTKRAADQYAAARAAKARKRLEGPAPDYPPDLPDLRRLVIVIDFDTGKPIIKTMALHRSRRIDQYRAVIGGKVWKRRAGWSEVLRGLRMAMPRVAAS